MKPRWLFEAHIPRVGWRGIGTFLVVWEIGGGGYICRVGQCEQSLGRQRARDPRQEGVEPG